MTEQGKPVTNKDQDSPEPLSRVDTYLVEHGLDTLAQLGEIPRKKGKPTQHDQMMRAHIDQLVRIIKVFAEDLIEARERAGRQEERHLRTIKRFQAAQKALGHAAGAAKVMWLMTCVLRSYGGSPVAYATEEGTPADGHVGQTYTFAFSCGVSGVYRPWRDLYQLQVTLDGGAIQYFAVNFNGTMSPKEEEALVGFLMRHGISAMFPLKVASREDVMDSPLLQALIDVGIDPAKVTVHGFGDDTFMVVR